MPRRARCLPPGVACHVTQRGVDRRDTFSSDDDRATCVGLLRDNLETARVRLLGWCLMSNHVHLVAVPEREDSMSVLLRRVHGRNAQYYNARWGRTGHLWQSRFFACPLELSHLGAALAYVDLNPVRAGLVVEAGEYRWSSAAAHSGGRDVLGVLDLEWWRREALRNWATALNRRTGADSVRLRDCTCAGRPFGTESFVVALEGQFGRQWARRERRRSERANPAPAPQRELF